MSKTTEKNNIKEVLKQMNEEYHPFAAPGFNTLVALITLRSVNHVFFEGVYAIFWLWGIITICFMLPASGLFTCFIVLFAI